MQSEMQSAENRPIWEQLVALSLKRASRNNQEFDCDDRDSSEYRSEFASITALFSRFI